MSKIKVPDNGERIIVVDAGHREGCFLQTLNVGCALIFAIIGLLVLGSCWMMHKVAEDMSEKPPQTLQDRTGTQTRPNTNPAIQKGVEAPPRVSHDDPPKTIATPTAAPTPTATPAPTAAPTPTAKIVSCSKCQGRGTIVARSKCSKCGGTGRIYASGKWQSCPKVETSGERKCRACDGTGKITVIE